jgi:hypothetical protein
MSRQDVPGAHEDLYVELMESANRAGTFVLETSEGHPDVEFEVQPADKATRNKLRRMMPSGLLDGIELPDNVEDADDISMDDIDLSGLSIQDMTFDEEATNTWLDVIAEHYKHEYYSESEVRNIFESLDDEFFISAGSYLIELGASTGPVTGFRRE